MKFLKTISIAAVTLCASFATITHAQSLDEGQEYYAIKNLHTDTPKNNSYALNYLLPKLVPICSVVKVTDIAKKKIKYTYEGQTYTHHWDKHTKRAGVSIKESFMQFFSTKAECEEVQEKVKTMSDVDRAGIQQGVPKVGMTKEAVLLAIGYPPKHATPSLDSTTWMYWLNKWKKQAVDFDANGIVIAVRL